MNAIEQYIHDRDEQVRKNLTDRDLAIDIHRLTESLVRTNYVKNYTWRGVPTLQYPTDLMVMQELIWKLRPDYIIETGIAFGGMTRFYSDMQSPRLGAVISIDVDIRLHAKVVLVELDNVFPVQASSTAPTTPKRVKDLMGEDDDAVVLVTLDSNHTHDHVLQELKLYSPMVSVGSYIVVFDTAIQFYGHLDKNQDRPWGKGNNPWAAVQAFMKGNDEFVVDKEIEQRAVITSAPGGWLRRVK
jgi:cephalosporin hydroxylase